MNVRINFIVFLLVIVTILTTTDCSSKGQTKRKLRNMIGFTPRSKENDIETLKHLVLNEADLIKAAAYKKLIKLYKAAPETSQKELLLPVIITAAIELVKNYAAISNLANASFTVLEGRHYVKSCFPLLKNDGLCYKLKTQLYDAYFFGHKLYGNRLWRNRLSNALTEAKKHLKTDRTILFLETKLSCEMKLRVQNSNKISKTIKSLVTGSAKKEKTFDCINKLLEFKDEINNVGSYIGEYYYLLGRAYAKNKDNKKAMESLDDAREDIIVDSKKRNTNKAVQDLLEKLYFRVNKNM